MKKFFLGLLVVILLLGSFFAYCGVKAKNNILTSCHGCSELKKQNEAISENQKHSVRGEYDYVFVYDYTTRQLSKYQIDTKLVLTEDGVVDVEYAIAYELSLVEQGAQKLLDTIFEEMLRPSTS